MPYNFGEIIDRRGTYSAKHDPPRYGKPSDVLPMWVADMDFRSPPCVLEALEGVRSHGIFGYFETEAAYFRTLQSWFARRFGWNIENDWLVLAPGVVHAVHMALLALTEPGDAVLVQQPLYGNLTAAVSNTERRLVVSELVLDNGRYEIDFDDFERKIATHQVKLFLLCSPHNPAGRVWTRDELIRMGEVCMQYGVTVIADEIHQDFIYSGHKHHVFAELAPRFADISVTCTAPTKTFNLAAMAVANLLIPNERLRERYLRQCTRIGHSQLGVMNVAACQAAYAHGEAWLEALLHYLEGNMVLLAEFLRERLPDIRMIQPEGTYLAWLDFRALGLDAKALDERLTREARLWLSDGTGFGAGGEGFMRLNAACPRAILQEAMERLEKTFG